jgi:hypothetical protein
VIVSASYRTDIPAFYAGWFLRRLDAGFCRVINPYSQQPYTVSLRRQDCDGFVFWTKNLGPFFPALAEVRRRGFPFIVQYTINGYPRELEWSVTGASRAGEHMKRIAGDYGAYAAVWRYDTVLDSSLTPRDWHLRNFERLALAIRGSTNECVVSFAQFYKKTRVNLDAAARLFRFEWSDPASDSKRELLSQLAAIARSCGIQATLCAQPGLLVDGVLDARCVDAARLGLVAGYPIRAGRKGNREGCACDEARDIGDYDTCPHGCVYCYAVRSRALARRRFNAHDPAGEFLLPQPGTKP